MIHARRRYQLHAAASPEQLAHDLSQRTWTLCTAFLADDYLFLNDSFSEDGAQEYAVVKLGEGWPKQVESITFSWCSQERALEHIRSTLANAYDAHAFELSHVLYLDAPDDHHCPMCM